MDRSEQRGEHDSPNWQKVSDKLASTHLWYVKRHTITLLLSWTLLCIFDLMYSIIILEKM